MRQKADLPAILLSLLSSKMHQQNHHVTNRILQAASHRTVPSPSLSTQALTSSASTTQVLANSIAAICPKVT